MSEVQRIREPTIVCVLETFPNGGCAHSKQIVEVIPRELISGMHRVSHGRSRREERAKVKWSEEWSEVIVEKDDNRRMRRLIRTRCVGLLCGVQQNTAEDANEGRRGRQEESQGGPDSQGE